MSNLQAKEYKSFEEIKRTREDGTEYWNARELSEVLQYKKWENFAKVIDRAKIACQNSGRDIDDDFAEVSKIVKAGATQKKIMDYELSRYACYLIVQNGDPRKDIIALGQTYFAIQTRRQEVADYFNQLDGDNIGSTELIANLFRISQIEEKLKKDKIHTCRKATSTHYEVGTMPEDLPTPKKNIKQVEKEQLKRLKEKKTRLMLDE